MKSALITGGAGAVGFAIAEYFAERGVQLALTSRELARAEAAAESLGKKYGVKCAGFELELDDESSTLRLFDRLCENNLLPDSVILSAANLGLNMNPLETSADDFTAVLKTNVTGAFLIIRESAKRGMTHGGSAVIIGSNTSRRAIKSRSAYIASKGALVSLTKALAIDFGSRGIRVNCLLPGSIHSERWDALDDTALAAKRSRIPLGREAMPNEVARAAYYLASEQSSGMTGAELVLDGGVDAQLFPGT